MSAVWPTTTPLMQCAPASASYRKNRRPRNVSGTKCLSAAIPSKHTQLNLSEFSHH